jgi:hypothetical protein
MAEYWQDVLDRAQVTHAVWDNWFSDLAVGGVALDAFQDLMDDLQPTAQARDTAVQTVDNAQQTRDFAVTEVRLLDVKVPQIMEGQLDEESGLLDDLGKVYGVDPNTPAKALKRGQLLAPLWASANAWLLGRTPPRPAIVRGTVTQANFLTKLAELTPLGQSVADADEALDAARGLLRRKAKRVESLCIRFLKAARGVADDGSAADEALDTIPTTTVSDLPETLGIRTFTQGGTGGLHLLVAYEPYALEPDETAELQWQVLDVDPGWDHSAAYDPSGQALGPFTVGQTVRVRTRVTNAHGTRDGGARQLTLIAPAG